MKHIVEFLVTNHIKHTDDLKYSLITSLNTITEGEYIKFKDHDEHFWIFKVAEIDKNRIRGTWAICTTANWDDDMWCDNDSSNFEITDVQTIEKKLTTEDKLYIDLLNDYVEHHQEKESFYLNKKTLQFKKG